MNQKRCLIPISLRYLLFITILRNIKEVNEIMRFLYPKYRRNRLTAQRAGGAVIMTSLIIVRRLSYV